MKIDTDGFAIFSDVFLPAECDALLAALAHPTLSRGRAGTRHLIRHPSVTEIATDKRLVEIAKQAFGDSAVPYRATLFEKTEQANWLIAWHQDKALPIEKRVDDPEWGTWSTKAGITYAHAPVWALERVVALRLHLDASLPANGPLRVLPGTHGAGILTHEQVRKRVFRLCSGGMFITAWGRDRDESADDSRIQQIQHPRPTSRLTCRIREVPANECTNSLGSCVNGV